MRRRQRPGNSTWTSVSTSRTNAWSGPPRARIASRSSGRRAQAEANAARRMEAAILAIGMRRGWVTGFVLAGWLVACRHVTPPRPVPAPPAAPAANEAIPKVLDYLAPLPDVDPARTGIGGTSTSGFVALQAIAVDRRLIGAAVVSACGNYHRFLHLSNLAMNGHPLDLDPAY